MEAERRGSYLRVSDARMALGVQLAVCQCPLLKTSLLPHSIVEVTQRKTTSALGASLQVVWPCSARPLVTLASGAVPLPGIVCPAHPFRSRLASYSASHRS